MIKTVESERSSSEHPSDSVPAALQKPSVEYHSPSYADNYLHFLSHTLYTRLNQTPYDLGIYSPEFEANEILNGMYIGSLQSTYDLKSMNSLGITHIVVALPGYSPTFPHLFDYLVIGALDSTYTNLSDSFNIASDFIQKAFDCGGKVLIACMAGRSRSATIAAAYLIKTFGLNSSTAIDFVKKSRCIIDLNSGFEKQLRSYATSKQC